VNHRILIVGCGSIGQRHLRCFQRTGRAEVTACDIDQRLVERVCSDYAVVGFNDWLTALLAQHPDAVVVATPAHLHVPIAVRALRHGAAALIEKPLSTRLDDLPSLYQAVAESGRAAAVAYVYRFVPGLAQMREFLNAGTFGQPLQISVVAGQHFPTFRPAYREIYYAKHETGGGAIQDALTHLADAVQWLAGPATRLYCEAARQSLDGVEVEDTVCVTARHGNVLAGYTLNQFQSPNELTVQVHCEHGSLRFENHRQRWSVFPRGANGWEHRAAPVSDRDDLFVAQANAFLDAIEGRETPLCTVAEAERALKFNLAAIRSARELTATAIG
jgi:predicted dehydrogenase